MKNYIGVKIVKAEPKEKNGVPGYGVKYPDVMYHGVRRKPLKRHTGNWTARISSTQQSK